jgi:hypothetical protein
MGALQKAPSVKAEVVSDPSIMSGEPVVRKYSTEIATTN